MGRKLIIVESPNKVKTIQGIVGDDYIVRASVGHISEINNSGLYNMGIDPNNNFETDYIISKDKEETVTELKALVKSVDEVYICSDPDREGEAIAWSLKHFLKIPNKKYKRVTFHEITKNAVLKAFETPRLIDDDLVNAAQSRQKLDKIVGYRLSPIAKKGVQAISVGRCQSAGLKLIVDREMEIKHFIPETYYEILIKFTKNEIPFTAKYVGTKDKNIKKITSEKQCEKILESLIGNRFVITNIETKERKSNPKAPFTTSTFQQEVSSRFGIGVKQAMSYAQKLFEGIDINGEHIALITYIRTDSTEFAPEFLPILESYVKSNYGNKYYAPIKKTKKKENVQDGHEAIRPVDLDMTPEKLKSFINDERLVKVYEIIYNRTIACAMSSAITSETIYTILNGDNRFEFKSNELLFDGYKIVYGAFEDKDTDVNKVTFKVDEIIEHGIIEPLQKQTTPPARYKESTFIKELENKGIGRPSTFATIVETLLSEKRNYCTIIDKCIVPTEMGIKLSKFLDENFNSIININYTSELEQSLDLISKGKLNHIEFLKDFYTKLETNINKVAETIKVTQYSDMICPECGKPMVYRNGPYGKFLGCSGYPKCKHIEKIKSGE